MLLPPPPPSLWGSKRNINVDKLARCRLPDERTRTYALDIHVAKPCYALSEAVFYFMYRRRMLCTLHGGVDFLIVLSKGLYGWGGGGGGAGR
jgi:hypothetical protein